MMKILFVIVALLVPIQAFSAITFTGGEWSTTFDCAGWQQNTSSETTDLCDGMGENGNWPYSCGGLLSEISANGNNASGGGGLGFRESICTGTNSCTSAPLIMFPSAIPEFWFRLYMRYPANFTWSDFIYHKWFADMPDYEWIVDLYNGVSLYNGGWYNGTGVPNPSTILDGQWHYYEFHLKVDTNGSNGIFQVWMDNVLVTDFSNVNYFGNNFTGFSIGVNQAVVGTGGWWDLDDIAISTNGYIGPLGADTFPNDFSFTDQTGVALGSTNNSDNVTVTGIDNTTTLVLTGDASCKYSINGAAWATANDNVTVNDNVALQNVASSSYNTAISCTLNLGGVTDTWTRTTLAATAAAIPQSFRGGGMGNRK